MGLVIGKCGACEVRDREATYLRSEIARLTARGDCASCTSLAAQVAYLKEMLERREAAWANERDEYKRTTDRLIEQAGARPIGQGQSAGTSNHPVELSAKDIMGMFEEREEPRRG